MKAFLAEHADPSANLTRLVGGLVFHIESGLVRNRLIWEGGCRLRVCAAHLRSQLARISHRVVFV